MVKKRPASKQPSPKSHTGGLQKPTKRDDCKKRPASRQFLPEDQNKKKAKVLKKTKSSSDKAQAPALAKANADSPADSTRAWPSETEIDSTKLFYDLSPESKALITGQKKNNAAGQAKSSAEANAAVQETVLAKANATSQWPAQEELENDDFFALTPNIEKWDGHVAIGYQHVLSPDAGIPPSAVKALRLLRDCKIKVTVVTYAGLDVLKHELSQLHTAGLPSCLIPETYKSEGITGPGGKLEACKSLGCTAIFDCCQYVLSECMCAGMETKWIRPRGCKQQGMRSYLNLLSAVEAWLEYKGLWKKPEPAASSK